MTVGADAPRDDPAAAALESKPSVAGAPSTAAPLLADEDRVAPFLRVADPPDPPPGSRRNPFALNRTLTGHVMRMGLPVVAGMLTQTAVNILDSVMVGRLPPEVANPGQAAIGIALPFMWLIGGFLSALWVGTQALASRRAGEGDDVAAGAVLTNAMAIATASSWVFGALFYFMTPTILELYYNDPVVRGYATDYLQTRYIGVWAMVGTYTLKSFFDGVGRTTMFMVAAIAMNILNIVLNYLFIYGSEPLGISAMEVHGAAVASVIAAYSGFVLLALWALAPSLVRRYRYFNLQNLSVGLSRRIVRLSLPSGAATVVVAASVVGFQKVVDHVATVEGETLIRTATWNVLNLGLAGLMVGLASGSATGAMVSQALGAKRFKLADGYLWEAVRVWGYIMSLFGLLLFLFPEGVLLLLNPDPRVAEIGAVPLRLFALIYPITTMGIIMEQTFYGIGRSRFVMYVELFMHFVVVTPVAYLAGSVLGLGADGLFLGPVCYLVLLCLIMAYKFRFSDWQSIEI